MGHKQGLTANRCLRRIIVFTRYPENGAVKTRLIPFLGAENAAALQRCLTEHTLRNMREIAEYQLASLQICYDNATEPLMRKWLGNGLIYQQQSLGNLGRRMDFAFAEAFALGLKQVIVIGSDCPDLDMDIMDKAFSALEDKELVLGPAQDGGYYLIGLDRACPQLFDGIAWGTDQVRRQTLTIAARLGLRTCLLPVLNDIDRPEDLPVWEKHAR